MSLASLFGGLQQSVSTYFSSLGLNQWWGHRTKAFNGRTGSEAGNDFGLPAKTPVASISSGRVVYSQRMNSDPTSSVGWIVQVQQADGSLFHYHHLSAAAVHVGDYVQAGQVLGLSGGCPEGAYGSSGCTRHDKYSSGPHIEVRYSPTYNPDSGNWNQNWVDPMPAIQSYASGGIGVGSMLPSGAGNIADLLGNLKGAAGGALSGVTTIHVGNDFAQAIAGGLGAGIAKGAEQVIGDTMHPAADFSIRALLVVGGAVGLFVAIIALLSEGARGEVREKLGPVAGDAVRAEIGGQTAKAIVPAFGDRARGRVTEQRKTAPQISGANNLPQLPAPKAKSDAADEGQRLLDLMNEQVAAATKLRQAAGKTKAQENMGDAMAYQPSSNLGTVKGPSASDILADVKEHEPVKLPMPSEAQAGARKRQQSNIQKAFDRLDQARVSRNGRRRANRAAKRGNK